MKIIGLCGKAGVGKGFLCDYIESIAHAKVFPLAANLKRIARQEFDWNGEKDEKGRKLLQIIGTEVGRDCCGETFWVDKWYQEIQGYCSENWLGEDCHLILCDDVRFDNEAEFIRSKGGIMIEIVGRDTTIELSNAAHSSEAGISKDLIDMTYFNHEGNNHPKLWQLIKEDYKRTMK